MVKVDHLRQVQVDARCRYVQMQGWRNYSYLGISQSTWTTKVLYGHGYIRLQGVVHTLTAISEAHDVINFVLFPSSHEVHMF